MNNKGFTGKQSQKALARQHLCLNCLTFAFVLLPLITAQAQDPTRFENTIRGFEQADLASPPPADPVLFVGSSSIRVWPDLPGDFPDYPALNRGFGGSQMSDLLYFFDRIVAPYDPALILVYEGDNDLAGGKSVDTVYADYLEFLALVEQQLPGADVAFIATKPSPSRSHLLGVTRQFNQRLAQLADKDPHIWYIDIMTPMLNDSGQPRAELFGSDMLHMNAAGYDLWQSIVAPVLAAWTSPAAMTFLIDFGASTAQTQNGPSPDDPTYFWNNVTSATDALPGLVDRRNTPTDIGLEILSPFNESGSNQSGTTESSVFAANATRDSLYANTKSFSGFGDLTPRFKLTGLNPDLIYHFTFYGSRLGATDVRETGYTVSGANSTYVTLDPASNVDQIALATGVVPDAQGEVTISLEPTERNNNGYAFIYLGAMKMEEIPDQAPVVFLTEPADQTVVAYQPVTLAAKVDSTPPYVIQWFRDGEAIADANEFTYTIDPVTSELDGATFSVSVSNLLYDATSRAAVLTVVPDVMSPALLSAISTNGYSITLSFDERLDPDTATVIDNYVVNEGGAVVAAAELDAQGKTVTLTLNDHLEGAFAVRVNSVVDLAGNAVVADTTTFGRVQFEILLVDFGSGSTPTETDANTAWNNITSVGVSDSGQLLNLVTVDDRTTDIDLVMLSRFNGANQSGTPASALFPADATRDSLFGNTRTFSDLGNVTPRFKLSGLDPLLTYDFTFYASRMGVDDNRETQYTVTGGNTETTVLNAAVNINNSTTVTGIEPDTAGEITISLAPGANNTNGYHFIYLGVMKVEPSPIATGN